MSNCFLTTLTDTYIHTDLGYTSSHFYIHLWLVIKEVCYDWLLWHKNICKTIDHAIGLFPATLQTKKTNKQNHGMVDKHNFNVTFKDNINLSWHLRECLLCWFFFFLNLFLGRIKVMPKFPSKLSENFPSNFISFEQKNDCSLHQHDSHWKHIFGSMQLINCQREVRGKEVVGNGQELLEIRPCLYRRTMNLLIRFFSFFFS